MDQTPYDLERAATIGGFGDDQEVGQAIARRLHTVLAQRTADKTPFDAVSIVDQTVEACTDLWDWTGLREDEKGGMLAALANSVGAMLIDLIKQTREARGVA